MTDFLVLIAILLAPSAGVIAYLFAKFELGRNGYHELSDEDLEQDMQDFVAFLNEHPTH